MTTRALLAVMSLFILSGFTLPTTAPAANSVTWMEAVAPPFFIHEGKYQGQGYEDLVTDIITKNLPDYTHKRTLSNISRHYNEFKAGKQVCNVGLYKTQERKDFLHFSIPSFFTLPTVIIINKEKFADFGGTKTVKLETILNKDLIIGRSSNRSYGQDVDNILDTYGTPDNIFSFEGAELSLNFFEMLKLDRLDGLIGLSEEAMYQAERLGIRDQIMTLTIEENQKSYDSWLSYVACSKTEWGKEIIDKINEVLRQQRPTDRYRGSYERWLDESSYDSYRKLYHDVFLKVTE